jgi:hypothetical protein
MARVITKLPLKSLETFRGIANWIRDIGLEDIRNLLRNGVVRFIVADIGPNWNVWRNPIAFRDRRRKSAGILPNHSSDCALEDWQGEYLYTASEWNDGGSPIVLLTKQH